MADEIQARMKQLDKELDAFIWNAVRYLDSPTDYREYLPRSGHPASAQQSQLVMLDDVPRHVRSGLWIMTLAVILICLILLVLLRN